jgi:peptidoglycan/LPS O-acetylase OafA/YrhL
MGATGRLRCQPHDRRERVVVDSTDRGQLLSDAVCNGRIASVSYSNDRCAGHACCDVFLTLVYGGLIAGFAAPKTEATLLQLYFLAGGLFCLVGHYIDVSIWTVVGLVVVAYLSKGTTIFPSLQTAVILIAGLWLSTTTALKAIRLPGDYSYGVYLYGFFVQQCIKAAFPLLDLRWHQLLCMLIALACGAASWHLLERSAMLIWKRRAVYLALAR